MSFIRRIKRKGRIYLAEVENRWVNGTCVQRHIRYVGREADGKTILSVSMSHVEVEQVKVFGPLLVLNALAGEIGLGRLLGEYGSEILAMVYAHCLDYRSLHQFPSWFERTDLNLLLPLENVTEKRLLQALDSLEKQSPQVFQQKLFENVRQHYSLKPSGVLYDVTNTYLYGKHCSLGKLGRDKEGVRGRPLIQIALAVTQKEGIPLFHKVFEGNTPDSRTLLDLIPSIEPSGIKNGFLIYDRGITSGQNLQEIQALGWNTLCGIHWNPLLKKFWASSVTQHSLVDIKNRVRLKNAIFYVTTRPYTYQGVRGVLALCYNEQKQKDLRESRYDLLVEAQKLLRQRKKILPELQPFFNSNHTLLTQKLSTKEQWDGYSCLFSTKSLPKEELVRLYFEKDLIEKAFRTMKGITHLQPVRHWLSRRVTAHIFLCYLAYLLLSLLQNRLQTIGISSEEALRELETMYKVYLKDSQNQFKISRVVALTRRQELILKTIDKKLLNT